MAGTGAHEAATEAHMAVTETHMAATETHLAATETHMAATTALHLCLKTTASVGSVEHLCIHICSSYQSKGRKAAQVESVEPCCSIQQKIASHPVLANHQVLKQFHILLSTMFHAVMMKSQQSAEHQCAHT